MILNILQPLLILGILGLVFGVVLGFAAKKFHVEVDPIIPKLRDSLPGANCGGCGFTGCDAYAKALAEGTAKPGACPVGGDSVTAQLAEILGVEADDTEKMVAFVKCCGTPDVASVQYDYHGIHSCIEAAVLPGGGPKSCAHGCMGFGSCVDVCQFDAIHIENGVARVDKKRCVACGACVQACPKHLIDLVPASQEIHVYCSNPDRGKDVKAVCESGCIGCTLCVRNCPNQAISMQGGIAVIDPSKCTQCGLCQEKCPAKVIRREA